VIAVPVLATIWHTAHSKKHGDDHQYLQNFLYLEADHLFLLLLWTQVESVRNLLWASETLICETDSDRRKSQATSKSLVAFFFHMIMSELFIKSSCALYKWHLILFPSFLPGLSYCPFCRGSTNDVSYKMKVQMKYLVQTHTWDWLWLY